MGRHTPEAYEKKKRTESPMDSNNKARRQFVKTLLLSIIAMLINYGISLVLTPYITEILGPEAYGFVSLAKTVSNYGIIITTCLNSYAGRFIVMAYHRKDLTQANKYYSTVILANVGLLLAVMLGSVFFIWNLQSFFVIPDHMLFDVRLLFGLDILNFMLLALANMFSVYATVKDKLHATHLTRMVSYLAEACVLVLLYLVFRPKIYYVGIALLVSTAVLGVINYIKARKELPELQVRPRDFSKSAVKQLVGSGIWNSITSVGNLLNSGLDLWVSNLMLSATAMGQISVVKTLSTIFSTLCQLLATPLHPTLLKQYSQKNIPGVTATFVVSMKINGFFAVLFFAGFGALGKIYYQLWTPTQDTILLYQLTMITFAGSVGEGIAYPLFYIYTLTLKNKVPGVVTVLSGLLNVGGMFVLIRAFDVGVYAVVLTTTVLGWLNYFVFTPLYAAKCLGCSPKAFYKAIGQIMFAGIFMAGAVYAVSLLATKVSWLTLLVAGFVSVVVCVPVFIFAAFNKQERGTILGMIPFFKNGKPTE